MNILLYLKGALELFHGAFTGPWRHQQAAEGNIWSFIPQHTSGLWLLVRYMSVRQPPLLQFVLLIIREHCTLWEHDDNWVWKDRSRNQASCSYVLFLKWELCDRQMMNVALWKKKNNHRCTLPPALVQWARYSWIIRISVQFQLQLNK